MSKIILGLLSLLGHCVSRMPFRIRKAMAVLLGSVLQVISYRRKVIEGNLNIAFSGQQNEGVRKRLLREAYLHLGFLFPELLMLFGGLKSFIERRTSIIGAENYWNAKKQGKGIIFLASHLGNWEIMAGIGAKAGFNVMIVTKHLKPEWIHQAVERGRASAGYTGTYEPKTMKAILKQIKSGDAIGMILDQYAGPPIGIRVPFFGVPVGTNTAVAAIALRTGAAVLPAICHRQANGDFVLEIKKPFEVEGGSHADAHATEQMAQLTADMTAFIESAVRQFPEQWLWTHRRFKGDLSPLKPEEWTSRRSS